MGGVGCAAVRCGASGEERTAASFNACGSSNAPAGVDAGLLVAFESRVGSGTGTWVPARGRYAVIGDRQARAGRLAGAPRSLMVTGAQQDYDHG